MNIVVCVKHVPDATADRKFESDNTVDRVGVDGLLSELDEYAVEQALRIADAGDDVEVVAVTVGPDDAAVAWAAGFANAAPWALRAAKECIDRGLETDLETGLEIERQQFAALFATEDRTIGMESFIANGPGKAEFRGV